MLGQTRERDAHNIAKPHRVRAQFSQRQLAGFQRHRLDLGSLGLQSIEVVEAYARVGTSERQR